MVVPVFVYQTMKEDVVVGRDRKAVWLLPKHNLFNIDKINIAASLRSAVENGKVEAERRLTVIIIFVASSGHRPRARAWACIRSSQCAAEYRQTKRPNLAADWKEGVCSALCSCLWSQGGLPTRLMRRTGAGAGRHIGSNYAHK